MAFNHDFTAMSSLPANFNATVDDPSRFSANGYLLKAGEVLRVDDGSVSSSLAADVTVVAQKVNPDDGGIAKFILLNTDPTNLWTSIKLTAYPNMVLYSGSGDSQGVATAPIRVNAQNWGSHLNPFTLHMTFDGDVWESTVTGSASTKTSTLTYSESAFSAPVVNSGNMLIETPVDIYIKSINAFEYITAISDDSPTEGSQVTLTGNFAASQQAGDKALLHINGEVEDITSEIVSWNSTTIVLNLNTTNILYGAGQLEIQEAAGTKGKIALTLNPPTNTEVVDVVDPVKNVAGQESLFDSLSGTTDVLNGDQIHWDTVAGLTVRADGTFIYSGTATPFNIRYRIYSKALDSWTAYATATINVNFASLVNLTNPVTVVGTDTIDMSVDHSDNTGNIYFITSKNPVRPSLAQAKLGKDAYGATAVDSQVKTPDASGTTSASVTTLRKGSYYMFAIQETAAGDITNMLWEKSTVLGTPVTPVISVQPVGGSIQESISTSAHIFTVTANPVTNMQWQIQKNGGAWENVPNESSSTFEVRGNQYLHADSPIKVRAYLAGEGGASTYTDEVTLTVTEAPYLTFNIPGLPAGDVYLRAWLTPNDGVGDATTFHAGTVTAVTGTNKVYVDTFSGRKYTGFIYFYDTNQGKWIGTGIKGTTA